MWPEENETREKIKFGRSGDIVSENGSGFRCHMRLIFYFIIIISFPLSFSLYLSFPLPFECLLRQLLAQGTQR